MAVNNITKWVSTSILDDPGCTSKRVESVKDAQAPALYAPSVAMKSLSHKQADNEEDGHSHVSDSNTSDDDATSSLDERSSVDSIDIAKTHQWESKDKGRTTERTQGKIYTIKQTGKELNDVTTRIENMIQTVIHDNDNNNDDDGEEIATKQKTINSQREKDRTKRRNIVEDLDDDECSAALADHILSRSSSLSSDATVLGDVKTHIDYSEAVGEYTMESCATLNKLRLSVIEVQEKLQHDSRAVKADEMMKSPNTKESNAMKKLFNSWERHTTLTQEIKGLENELSIMEAAIRRIDEGSDGKGNTRRGSTANGMQSRDQTDALIEAVKKKTRRETIRGEIEKIMPNNMILQVPILNDPDADEDVLNAEAERVLQLELDKMRGTLAMLEEEIAYIEGGTSNIADEEYTTEDLQKATETVIQETKELRVGLVRKKKLIDVAEGTLKALDEEMDRLLSQLRDMHRGGPAGPSTEGRSVLARIQTKTIVEEDEQWDALRKSAQSVEWDITREGAEKESMLLMEKLVTAGDELAKLMEKKRILLNALDDARKELANTKLKVAKPVRVAVVEEPTSVKERSVPGLAAEVEELRRTLRSQTREINNLRKEWYEAKERERARKANARVSILGRAQTITLEELEVINAGRVDVMDESVRTAEEILRRVNMHASNT
ncbi:hypothetical protein FOL47_002522 [Perkinsus chesapeaki]|uniref:Uncharacterized protein n=1 Tax=Perkinsus chesapeaki TaxID=330153 RepID=A0A7J6N096_PERCH|nr:hypothetical protein FOL47_002522 [Perkinsus chesapeaki]